MEEMSALFFIGCCLFIPMLLSISIDFESIKVPEWLKRKEKIVVQHVYIYKTSKYQQDANNKKEQDVKIKNEDHSPKVKDECLQSLLALGMKKSDAKNKIKKMWQDKNYSSVESFLIDAYRV
jgi:hypothetical protein